MNGLLCAPSLRAQGLHTPRYKVDLAVKQTPPRRTSSNTSWPRWELLWKQRRHGETSLPNTQTWKKPSVERPSTFGVVQPGHSFLLGHVPYDEQVVCGGGGKQVWVVRAPADGRDGLLVFWHDGSQLELIVLLVQLSQTGRANHVWVLK